MNREHADAALFGDALACEDLQRAAFVPQQLDPAWLETVCSRAEIHLSAIAIIEDSRNEEEEGPQGLALRRIEAKLDLLLTLVGNLNAQANADPRVLLRWSAQGVRMPAGNACVEGSTGLFRMQATPWLPEPLVLPAVVLACAPSDDGTPSQWLQFAPLPDATRAALERHVFRQHRRAIAELRAQRDQ
ncbi:PilZ domain-containing protein [Thermomonas fusca]|uniref:PilZ domain-containing protein n=1 Tax=Thermomonas fusca TaxID=215690 RepID=UPI0003FA0D7F|nr:PilZ domain-containing protein [Thermomonas fusca]